MFWYDWSRLPRKVAVLLAAATLLPLATLLWFGWLVLKQDRALEEQQIRQRVERAADLAVVAFERAVAAAEKNLANGADRWPEGAVVVTFQGDSIQVQEPDRLAYLPVAPRLPEPPKPLFAAGENLEFRQRDYSAAAGFYRKLAKSRDPVTRAGALLRLARSLRAAGQPEEALPVYADLLETDNVAFDGVPASLIARHARCVLLETLLQTDSLQVEAQALEKDFRRGRWGLSRPVTELYQQDFARWGVSSSPLQSDRELLAESLEMLWQRWSAAGLTGSGRELIVKEGGEVVACWIPSEDGVSALLATRRFVETEWLEAISPVLWEQGVDLALHGTVPVNAGAALRRAGETGLPWSVIVTSLDPPLERSQYEFRRRLLITGFVILVLLASLASYLIFRALSREVALARLQTDFVAAVSHEFRTPLTSLRQFTDMLQVHANLSQKRRELCYEAQDRATTRLTRLVESLLDFGRMEGGARPYRFRVHNCGELVQNVVDEFRQEPASAEFQIRVTQNGSAEVNADAEALGRAIWNLLDNAVKYSGESREVDVELDRRGREIAILVRDRGLGIPPVEQESISHRFRRGEEALRLGIRGTGIGLAMVEHIVKAHTGRLELRSEPGQGSTFSLILPVRE